jgi:glycosyltransferase involved in cell wall biosynthesis
LTFSSLLDAMCFGRAVVARETGGIPEAVVHGRTGLLVPVGDPSALAAALLRLLLAPPERAAMGREGRRRFERLFTAERMVEATLRSYDQLPGSFATAGRPASQHTEIRPEAWYA